MVEDICVSVLFCFGCEFNLEDVDKVSFDMGLLLVVVVFLVNGFGGFILMWLLLIVVNFGVVFEDMCVWIVGCFDKIGYLMGIN